MKPRGFTLVEVLVALAILSLIMLATVTAFRTLANTAVVVDRQTGRIDEIRAVSTFLRNTFSSAVTGSTTGGLSLGGGTSDRTVFDISPEGALIWKAVVLFGEGFGGSYLVRVAREDQSLVLRWREPGNEALRDGWNNTQSRTLVSDVDAFEVAYRRQPGDDWQLRWDDAGPPGWVRMRVRAHERYWPDLVMRVAQ